MTKKALDEATIRILIDDMAKAFRAKDADRVMSHYAANAVRFDLAPPLQYAGADAVDKKGLEDWFSTWRGPIAMRFGISSSRRARTWLSATVSCGSAERRSMASTMTCGRATPSAYERSTGRGG
jgi:ketosteroid isomerase-like protein